MGGTASAQMFNRSLSELLYSFALLVSYCAGGLASGLAGRLAVAAAALSSGRLEICLVDSCDVLQKEHLFL